MRHSTSKASLRSTTSTITEKPEPPLPTTKPSYSSASTASNAKTPGSPTLLPMVHAANAALLERPQFAIDDAQDDDDDFDEDIDVGATDDQVMDEVRIILSLPSATVICSTHRSRWTHSWKPMTLG